MLKASIFFQSNETPRQNNVLEFKCILCIKSMAYDLTFNDNTHSKLHDL